MRKRERENPCDVCGHYHKYEEGEVCGVCGHRVAASLVRPIQQSSAFPSEIVKDFLYLGSYDNASRREILKTLGITHVLNVSLPPLACFGDLSVYRFLNGLWLPSMFVTSGGEDLKA
ncbi:hypothetical protein B296_00019301 [Ensete ventricosum]|uniref:Protein-tyrosine-phosphatase n=1 Tax=Ensete ventricosum TaxID=4639 RepID=A0A426ZGX5_ENSVE|nr:hypothetical protein B296_00019301 [Ensete ventricosum]